MDTIKSLGELSLGSRLKRLSDLCMKNIQKAYQEQNIDFDPYLFPAFHHIANVKSTTNTDLFESLRTSQPAVTQTVNKLLKKGLIKHTSHQTDKRKKVIVLSKDGVRFHQRLRPIWRAMERAVKQYTHQPAATLVDHLNDFEAVVHSGAFLETIREYIQEELSLTIIQYNSKYASSFYDLNIEWLETYFYVEDYDREVLSKPKKYILDKGGYIFFVVEDNKALGTVALMKADRNRYELTKMAVHPDARGRKIGQQLMQHCIDFATSHEFELFLYSNTLLENAIHIYRKYGFVEVTLEQPNPYKRSNIKMEYPNQK